VWTYTPQLNCGSACQTVTTTNPAGDQTVYTFSLNQGLGAWATNINYYHGPSSGSPILTTQNQYTSLPTDPTLGNWAYTKLQSTTVTIPGPSGNLVKKTTYTYDQSLSYSYNGKTYTASRGQLQNVTEYGFNSSTPYRTTYFSYLNPDPAGTSSEVDWYTSRLDMVTDVSTYDGSGNKLAETKITYDDFPVTPVSTPVVQHDTTSANLNRGNPTTIQRLISGSNYAKTILHYDNTGQIVQISDPNTNNYSISYNDNFRYDSSPAQSPPSSLSWSGNPTNAYPTSITLPLVGAVNFAYFWGSGKQAFTIDPNSADSYSHFLDPGDRLTHSFLPATNGNRGWSFATYSANETQRDTYSAITDAAPSASCVSCVHNTQTLDSLARPSQSTLASDPDGPTYTVISYDSSGHANTVKNPYRTTSDPTYGVTTRSYDSLGRPTLITEADNSKVNLYYGAYVTGGGGISSQLCAPATSGNGYPMLQIDEAGKKKQTWADAFGRTIEVDEPDSTGTLSLATCYAFDPSGNLTRVDQQGGSAYSAQWRSRTFGYDSLSRLLSATEPESGTTTYAYDPNGNLLTKTNPTGGTPGAGTVTITGHEQSIPNCTAPQQNTSPQIICPRLYDYGDVYVTVNGFTASASYGQNSTTFTIATALAAALNGASSPVSASSSANVVTLTAKPSGSPTNYSLSTSVDWDSGDFSGSSFKGTPSGTTLTGGPGPSNQTVTVSYCYDALNRPTAKAYTYSPNTPPTCSGTPPTFPSPVATYLYDQTAFNGLTITNGIGRRTGMTDAAGSEAWSYDTQGNVLADRRTTNGVTKTTSATYNLDGSLATLTYPSGRVVTYATNAAGRSVSATDTANSINYAAGAHYSPFGSLASIQNGAGIVSTYIFNNRFQPCWLYTTTSTSLAWNSTTCTGTATAANILDLKLNLNPGSGDNGNVIAITNNRDNTRSQNFAYDSLNRLASAQTQTTGVTIPNPNCWGLTFGYDPWGNLLNSSTTGPTGCSEPLPLSVSGTASNQIGGYCYDAGGNLLDQGACPSGAHAYAYNAENELTSAGGVTYTYDGDGKRVQKSNGKLYWYGMGSDPLDETDLTGSIVNTSFHEYIFFGGQRIARRDYQNNVNYYFADHLGTSRVVASSSGTILDDSDFYPFGGERPVTSSSGNPYKFTGYERDSESGLDYASARHYSSSLGRFLSPDPVSGSPGNPQTWNRYAYVYNNPLNATDPSGMCSEEDGFSGCDDSSGFNGDCPVMVCADLGFGIAQDQATSNWYTYSYGGWTFGVGVSFGPDQFYPDDLSIMSQIMNNPGLAANWTHTFNNANGLVTDATVFVAQNALVVTGVGAGAFGVRGLGILQILGTASMAQPGGPSPSDDSLAYEKYWQRYAPDQVTPGTRRLDFMRQSGRTGRFENSRVIYDEFGRQSYRIDFTDHMRPEIHSDPHLHIYEYGPGYRSGRESIFDFFFEIE
jgi:RHS repeat-associated protein